MVERLGEMRKGRKERIEKGSRERIEIERKEKETKENCSVAIVLVLSKMFGFLTLKFSVWILSINVWIFHH